MQFRTIQRADLFVAITAPPAVILAALNDKLTILIIAAASVAAIRAMFIRSVLVAYQAGPDRTERRRRSRLATVHNLVEHRESRDTVGVGAGDIS